MIGLRYVVGMFLNQINDGWYGLKNYFLVNLVLDLSAIVLFVLVVPLSVTPSFEVSICRPLVSLNVGVVVDCHHETWIRN